MSAKSLTRIANIEYQQMTKQTQDQFFYSNGFRYYYM